MCTLIATATAAGADGVVIFAAANFAKLCTFNVTAAGVDGVVIFVAADFAKLCTFNVTAADVDGAVSAVAAVVVDDACFRYF